MTIRSLFRRLLRERRWIPDDEERSVHEDAVRARLGERVRDREAGERAAAPTETERADAEALTDRRRPSPR
jgi:hypothetical protein